MNYFQHVLHRLKLRNIEPTGFIDVGAHFGETNHIIRSIYPNKRIVSFEANPACEHILKQQNIEYIIGLLGKENKTVSFYINPNDKTSTGCSIYKEESHFFQNAEKLELQMYRLDEIVPVEAKMDFLKMDVQGAEIDVLEGATKLLHTIKYIFLEVSFTVCNKDAPLFDIVFMYLYKHGYKIIDVCEPTYIEDVLVQTNFLFARDK